MSKHLIAAGLALATLTASATAAQAAVVVESDATRQIEDTPPLDNWVIYKRVRPTFTTPDSAAQFVTGPAGSTGAGSLKLTTATGSEKVFVFNYDHVNTPIGQLGPIAYRTNRASGSGQQVAALNLQVDYNGDAPGGFTTLVFEPVYNAAQGAVVNNTWQSWTASGTGKWWSTATINNQPGGAEAVKHRTWDSIVQNNPDAVVIGGVGVNQGSGNANLTSYVDDFQIHGTTYDFEPDSDNDGVADSVDNCQFVGNADQADLDNDGIGNACDATEQPTDKDECKDGGWQQPWKPAFENQGDCVSFVAAKGKAKPKG